MPMDEANVYAPIAARAAAEPGRLAVATPRARISFGELDAAVAKAAAILLSSGLAQAQRAGIDASGNLTHLILSLACARIGAPQLALPAADAPELRAATVRDLGLAAVISAQRERGDGPVRNGARPVLVEQAAIFNREIAPGIAIARSGKLDWLILKSSGTTGKPRYAMLTHAAAMLRSRRYGPMFDCRAGDVFWPLSHVEFVVAKQRAIFCLQRGAAVCLPHGLALAEALRFAADAGVTLACATPAHVDRIVTKFPRHIELPALRVFEIRSATVSEPLRKRLRRAVGDKLHVVYATNEAESITLASPELQARLADTVGLPVDGMTIEIVDENGARLPAGAVGEIRVKGPGVVDAYLDNPEATAKSFRNGWFHPGDLGSMDAAGALRLHGRTDDMMAFDGIKIYPAEIEQVLVEHPAVSDAAAFPVRSRRHQDIPIAAVVLRSPASEAELAAHCRSWLGAKTPLLFMILDEFPRNAMGKVLKRTLSEQAEARLRAMPPPADKLDASGADA